METELESFNQESYANFSCPKCPDVPMCPDVPKCPTPVCKMECPTNNHIYRSYSSNPYFDNFTLLYYVLTSIYFAFKSFSSIYKFLKVRLRPNSVPLNLPEQSPNSVPLSFIPPQNPSETSFHSV